MLKRTYRKSKLENAVKSSSNYRQVLKKLGLNSNGSGGYKSLQRAIAEWNLDTSHFDPYASPSQNQPRKEITEILTSPSHHSSSNLKKRLYKENLKQPICEKCGQPDSWRGKPMSLILDHINGTPTDNRLENLQIVCPNCNATLDTHCGKKLAKAKKCNYCQQEKIWGNGSIYCKPECRRNAFSEKNSKRLAAIKEQHLPNHKSMRPDYDELVRFVQENGYSATGRNYGVSDNAIRKWIKAYQQDLEITEAIRFNKSAWYQEHGRATKEELQALADQGLSLKEIARHYHVHRNTAKKWCQRWQVQTPGMQTASQEMN